MPSSRPASRERGGLLELIRPGRGIPLVMGVVNATPDSFYPGSRALSPAAASDSALRLCDEGADIVDIGAQSTRPGSEGISARDEAARILPVLEALAGKIPAPLSIDTDKAEVARLAHDAGASILNDVSALRSDPKMAETALRFQAVILMHRGGESPRTMQDDPRYGDVVKEVKEFLKERIDSFARAGGDPRRVLIDPGIGFGKTLEHNLSLIRHVEKFSELGPVVLGVSRKSFLGKIMAHDGPVIPGPEERLEGSLAAACWASLRGVKVLRVHDVKATRRALEVLEAVRGA